MRKTRNKQVYEEACEWVVDVCGGDIDAAARQRLDAWFRRSPEHIRAFLQLSCLWEELEDSDLDRGKDIEALIAQARASKNVFSLEGASIAASRRGSDPLHRRIAHKTGSGILTRSRFFSWSSGVLAAVVLVCLGLGIVALKVYWDPYYATGTGEQRTVHLADGSTVELNSRSRIRVLYSERERDVELVEGQALFRVAKDHARMFVVQSAGTRVRALGTQFDVYRKVSGTQVTVVEGRVAVSEALSSHEGRLTAPLTAGGAAADAPPVLVSTGEQVTVTNQEVPEPRRADLRAVTAWTQRKLVFDMTPIAEVVWEFNRYNTRKLVVSDPALAEFHVTGIFSSADPTSLLQFLQAQPDIDVVEAGGEIRISRK
jgi:transmembrane sensor